VIGSDYRGLGVVRSLGRRGVPVWVLDDGHVLATLSRYSRRTLPWPDDPAAQLRLLLSLAGQHGLAGWTLFPTGDETAALIARHHDLLAARFLLTTPPWDTLRIAHDKRLTYARAAELGIPHPRLARPGDAGDLTFPLILKPAWKETLNAFTQAKAWEVANPAELAARYAEAARLVDPERILVQELIPGGDQYSYAALVRQGRPVVEVVARRVRQYPPEFGFFSTFVESIERPEIEQPSRDFLRSLDYDGLIELEYKRDPRDGRYKLLDANPRVWGWHTLGRRAGGDFPWLAFRQARGESVAPARVPPGRRWLYAAPDALAALALWRRGRLSLARYLRTLRPPLQEAVFTAADPLPALLDLPLALKRRLSG